MARDGVKDETSVGRGFQLTKYVYLFSEGDGKDNLLLGGKGAGLCEMTRIGLPVPPGFVITTEACKEFYRRGESIPPELLPQVEDTMRQLEKAGGRRFGDASNPLLLSIRSGGPLSMPGMMDTILNLGLNHQAVEGLIKKTGNERFAYDVYRRLIQMFGKVVLGVDPDKFAEVLEAKKRESGVKLDTELTPQGLKEIANEFLGIVKRETGRDFTEGPREQLAEAIGAVFRSWNNKRAVEYREYYRIPHDLGTAVNVQQMVFGNTGSHSGSGVAFTRDPSTGEKVLFGEFLFNAQGEDVVAGIRTPVKISELAEKYPQAYEKLVEFAKVLEKHYRDMQDTEFTVQDGKLWMLQTRTGKRTALAAVKIAVDMCEEGLITKEEALLRVEPSHVEQLLHPRIDPKAKVQVIAKGINASPGAAVGKVVFDAVRAKEMAADNERVILVRPETNPDDVGGIIASQGILTARGGATSHAAVVSRGLGKPAVVGCDSIQIDMEKREFAAGQARVRELDVVTIDGSAGTVMLGSVPLVDPEITEDLKKLLSWADGLKRLGVWANADYPNDAKRARELGAEGIGLCRTERMFREDDRLALVREMILADTEDERAEALKRLEPVQRQDFKAILREMSGLPVVIRLLDLPLHEFLPRHEELLKRVVELRATGKGGEELERLSRILKRVEALREFNPMMGFRGCRVGILRPEIYHMQIRAIFSAACELKAGGLEPKVKVMMPLVGHVNEMKVLRTRVQEVAKEVMREYGRNVDCQFGTMVEVPRAALTADEIAQDAEFFSFGTNDLTQMTFGYSRDDAEGKFLAKYAEMNILEADPFQTIDVKGVGKLVKMGIELGRSVRPEMEIGICGEHGGDPATIAFCHEAGLDYVSASPYRVPVARLAAAHAALGIRREEMRTATL